MKKIIYLLMILPLVFTSCEIEEMNQDNLQLDGINSKNSMGTESASCSSSLEKIAANLPTTVDFCTSTQGPNAYLNISVTDGFISGDYGAWCIDDDLSIAVDTCYEDVNVFASTEILPDVFEYPLNFDKVNWLLNQEIVGEGYTYGDLQFAIWRLLDDVRDDACIDCGLGDWSIVRAEELVQLALDNGDGFIPGCSDFVGIILILDGVQPLIIPYKIGEECSPCDGKVTNLTLQNNGPGAIIKVVQKKDGAIVFEDFVDSGDSFSFSGTDKHGTLGTEIIIYADDVENTRIHTSCSQPIGPGLVSGDFEVLGGASRNGGELCPVDTPPDGGDDCGECDGKVTNLTMQNNGPDGFVRVEQKKDGEVVFEGDVASGDSFSFSGVDKNGTLGTEIIIYVDGDENTRIHTSCTQPDGFK